MTSNKGIKLILIPGHEEECKKVWETHVLLLASLNSKNICFGGPYRPELDYEAISAIITSLKPLGKTYALGLFEDQIERSKIDIDFSAKSYGAFIEKNMKDAKEISVEEHIDFLMYWVSSHLPCSRFLQIPLYIYNLSKALHFEEDICLVNFLLAPVYKVMEEAVEIMDTLGKMKPIARPLWIVQL
ncbi:hypothetical protein JHK87_055501 [Glycine soja]|nr:hypothetical protein JHK87_055501 [Glycine soja]